MHTWRTDLRWNHSNFLRINPIKWETVLFGWAPGWICLCKERNDTDFESKDWRELNCSTKQNEKKLEFLEGLPGGRGMDWRWQRWGPRERSQFGEGKPGRYRRWKGHWNPHNKSPDFTIDHVAFCGLLFSCDCWMQICWLQVIQVSPSS